MFYMFTNNVTKTSSDACNTAPSSCDAKNSEVMSVITGIVAAVPVISVLLNAEFVLTVSVSALILSAFAMMRYHKRVKKVKP